MLSPAGERHYIRDKSARNALADAMHVRSDHLAELSALDSVSAKPVYRSQWQAFQRVVWLERADVASDAVIFIIGDAEHFVAYFAADRDDTTHFKSMDPSRLQSFLNKGFVWNSGKKAGVLKSRGVQYEWRRCEAPSEAELIRRGCKMPVWAPHPYGALQARCH